MNRDQFMDEMMVSMVDFAKFPDERWQKSLEIWEQIRSGGEIDSGVEKCMEAFINCVELLRKEKKVSPV